MSDTNTIAKLVEQQVASMVNDQVLQIFASDEWLAPIEQKIVSYTQDRILAKFANAGALPEIVEVIKASVNELFDSGRLPGIESYINSDTLAQVIEQSTENLVATKVKHLGKDPQWIEKIERLVNQAVIQRIVASLTATDVGTVIRQRVDETMSSLQQQVVDQLMRRGIQDLAENCELTVLDGHVVVENTLTSKTIEIVDTAYINNLSVTGSVNVDNHSWDSLSDEISDRTLKKIEEQWRSQLVSQVADIIKQTGVDFSSVTINGEALLENGNLSKSVVGSNLQELGTLKNLRVSGEAHVYNTFSVVNHRVGVNTQEPEMALGLWDEEVSLLAGKLKNKTAFVGTGRAQALTLGVNREPAIEIDINGLTAVKKLQVGLHKINHGSEVPNYSGTRGDIVFNSSPTVDNPVFAWVCLGGHKWKVLKAV